MKIKSTFAISPLYFFEMDFKKLLRVTVWLQIFHVSVLKDACVQRAVKCMNEVFLSLPETKIVKFNRENYFLMTRVITSEITCASGTRNSPKTVSIYRFQARLRTIYKIRPKALNHFVISSRLNRFESFENWRWPNLKKERP